MTNEDQLTSKAVSDDMRLQGITTCHTEGRVTGLQFHMALDPYEAADEEVYDMAPIGLMSGECEKLDLPQGLDRIKATMNTQESSLSIKYKIFDADLLQEYGEVTDAKTTWAFTEENPLVGLYGRQTEAGIVQLGFITLDTACQLAHIEIPDPVIPVDPIDPTPIDNEKETEKETEEEESIIFGLSALSIALIVGGVLLLAALATASILSFVKRKGENLAVTASPSKIKPSPETDEENNAHPVNVDYSSSQKPLNFHPKNNN